MHRTKATYQIYNNENGTVTFSGLQSFDTSLQIDGSQSHGFQGNITNCHFFSNSDGDPVLNISNAYYPSYTYVTSGVYISGSIFSQSRNGYCVVCISYNNSKSGDEKYGLPTIGTIQISSTDFANNFNNDITLYLYYSKLIVADEVIFYSNAANKGGGIYFTQSSYAVLSDNASIQFINSTALVAGGAIYADYPDYTTLLFYVNGSYAATFVNNNANYIGNSIFLNLSAVESNIVNRNSSDENSIVYIPRQFNYSNNDNQIATSPYSISLGSTATCIS